VLGPKTTMLGSTMTDTNRVVSYRYDAASDLYEKYVVFTQNEKKYHEKIRYCAWSYRPTPIPVVSR
jgi:hypothetical protein